MEDFSFRPGAVKVLDLLGCYAALVSALLSTGTTRCSETSETIHRCCATFKKIEDFKYLLYFVVCGFSPHHTAEKRTFFLH
jgi:hypothetical protein